MALFHRRESPTQRPEDAALQAESGEIWGRPMRAGLRPVVQAYVGGLPPGVRGIEFTSDVLPDLGTPPYLAYWSGPRAGVRVEGGYAKIGVTITRDTQVR